MWGVYTRQYVAFLLFRAPAGCIVASGNPNTLVQRMRQAELAFTPGQARGAQPTRPTQAIHHDDAASWQGPDKPNPIPGDGPTAQP